MTLAVVAVTFAVRHPNTSNASVTPASPASFAFSGMASVAEPRAATFLRPSGGHQTRESVTALTSRADTATVRAAGAVSPTTTFSAGVSAATASSGVENAGVRALADIVDPRRPFELYTTQAGDSVSSVAARYNIQAGTLLDNNPTVEDRNLVQLGQQLVVPFKDGILYKIAQGDTLSSVVGQYDNITVDEVVSYRPNAVAAGETLEPGKFLLLVGAARKPPPPPPPPPRAVPNPGGSVGGTAPPSSGGRFSLPLNSWRGVSDPFGTGRGGGRIHEGIDLDLFGLWQSPIFSACSGVVSRAEYLTYGYGYYVVVDCGDGWSTLYAHMSQILVVPGQRVGQGTQVGNSGVTGYTTGEHLHFEIRFNGGPVNPANYLPF
ncbi:MAG: peptidoglycan DD-metalloendopeptidase family protein [Tepidiformaceae bacterium]